MLAVSPLASTRDEREGEATMEAFSIGIDDFPDFTTGNLLDSIDFDDIFIGIHDEDDELPDLEVDPELLAEFSISGSGGDGFSPEINTTSVSVNNQVTALLEEDDNNFDCQQTVATRFGTQEEVESQNKDDTEFLAAKSQLKEGRQNGDEMKSWSSSHRSKNGTNQGKRKTKVDWTPELHRRFVQAVEQLGVDKAVPSRILELMGIDCLTRHNIASHLQKYRSHRKHLLAREAGAATWSQKRQMYSVAVGGAKTTVQPWHAHAPIMGFPPPMPPPMRHPFRPLHVWGHPTTDKPMMPKWHKQLLPAPSLKPPQPAWAPSPPHPPPPDFFWHSNHQPVPSPVTPSTACFPHPPPTMFGAVPLVPGIPPHRMYKHGQAIGGLALPSGPQPPLDLYPTKESIDAAIGDVLAKPWLPLPLGLKPPSEDSVMEELQRQGIPKIPPPTPTCA